MYTYYSYMQSLRGSCTYCAYNLSVNLLTHMATNTATKAHISAIRLNEQHLSFIRVSQAHLFPSLSPELILSPG